LDLPRPQKELLIRTHLRRRRWRVRGERRRKKRRQNQLASKRRWLEKVAGGVSRWDW